jgi:hypothetical protein
MGRYPGSSTTLRPTPDGTKWDSGNPFDYSDGTERKSRVPISKKPSGKADKRTIFSAAAHAQRAVDFLEGLQPKEVAADGVEGAKQGQAAT